MAHETRTSAAVRPRRPGSLRRQLILIPTIILLTGLLVLIGTVLLNAQSRIAAEINSSMQLGQDLVATALRNVADAGSPALAFEHLAQDLPQVRHVQFELIPTDPTLFSGAHLRIGESPRGRRPLLARLLAPPSREVVFPVNVQGTLLGEIRLRSNSADEIEEILEEMRLFAGALVALCLLIVGALLWAVQRSLRLVQMLADGFDRLERGDYRPIPSIPIVELRRTGEQFNHLAESLDRVTSDNHRLIDKLLFVQEQERKELAAELHDEFGPALFGIRAEAACIMRLVPPDDRSDASVGESARTISDLADGIQKLNYRMLDRLRPLVLEQMGLAQALERLVVSWQTRYPHLTWLLELPRSIDEPNEAVGLMLYRVAQESVTNAIRHAEASAVTVQLEQRDRSLSLSITDNGRGLPANFRHGFGLLGMAERVRRLGGSLMIDNARPTGVVVEVLVPDQAGAVTKETYHAHPAD